MSIKIANAKSAFPSLQPKEVQKTSTVNISSKDLVGSSSKDNWLINGIKNFVQKIISILRCIFCCRCNEKNEELPASKTETKSKELTVDSSTLKKKISQTRPVADAKTNEKTVSQTKELSVTASSKESPYSLENVPLDLKMLISEFLEPTDSLHLMQTCDDLRQKKHEDLLKTFQKAKRVRLEDLEEALAALKSLSRPEDPIQGETDPLSILRLFPNAERLIVPVYELLSKRNEQMEKIAKLIKENQVLPRLKKIHFYSGGVFCLDEVEKGTKALFDAVPNLEEFIFRDYLNKNWLDFLSSKRSLKSIYFRLLNNDQFSLEDFTKWAKSWPHLQKLYLTGKRIANPDKILQIFAENCPNLRKVQLTGDYREGLKILGKHSKQLKQITLTIDRNPSHQEIEALAKGCPNLRRFYHHEFGKISYPSNDEAELIVQALTGFTKLEDIEERIALTPKVLSRLSQLRNLKSISIPNHPLLSTLSLPDTLRFHHVTSLELNYNQLTDESFSSLIQAFPELDELSIIGSENLTDKSLELIAKKFPNLKKLNINGSQRFTIEGVAKFLEYSTTLKNLEVRGCPQIGNGGYFNITE